jgi:hypothetical protein
MDRQCSSCGGFCRKSGCERENVKPEPEPVAWCIVENGRVHGLVKTKPAVMNAEKWQPLYTAPPQREWVGLTKEELAEIAEFHFHGALSGREFYDDVEAKLKEKNAND